MAYIEFSEGAWSDYEALLKTDPEGVAEILEALELIEADPKILEKLNTWGDIDIKGVEGDIKKWIAARDDVGVHLWRLHLFDTRVTKYRILYGYHYQTHQFYVLSLTARKDINYDDTNSPLAKRIFADWRELTEP